VIPSKWKKELKISSKEDSLKASFDLFNMSFKKKDHNIAEALLIAYYGQKERENHVKNDL
jgi:hypothetical protein